MTMHIPVPPLGGRSDLGGVPSGFDAFVLAQLAARQSVVFIATNDTQLEQLRSVLEFVGPTLKVYSFPAWDCLPYDRVSPRAEIMAKRIDTLSKLRHSKESVCVLTTVASLLQRVPPKSTIGGAQQSIAVGDTINLTEFAEQLVSIGYLRVGTVREPGEFAVRGGLMDVFPANAQYPVRLDLFGDVVESIRVFDPLSQRSGDVIKSFEFQTVGEILISKSISSHFCKLWRETFGAMAMSDPIYEAIGEGRQYPGQEHWLPFFYDQPLATLLDYCPDAVVVINDQTGPTIAERLEQIQDYYQTRTAAIFDKHRQEGCVYRPLKPEQLYLTLDEVTHLLDSKARISLSQFISEQAHDLGGRGAISFAEVHANPTANPYDALVNRITDLHDRKQRVLLSCFSKGSRDRFMHVLENHGMGSLQAVQTLAQVLEINQRTLPVTVLNLEHGFVSEELIVITEQDVLGERLARPQRKRGKSELFIAEASALCPGDLVVHVQHGLGRFDSLINIDVKDAPHDCVCVVYANDDKLFVPVENIEVLSRYGADREGVVLDRLGGTGWQLRKAKAKDRIREIADELLKLAAERQLQKGIHIEKPEGLFDEFCSRFPYVETDDQVSAIEQTLEDLARGQPMDRLICGDVGFGKTEVAIRAAFIAAHQGLQVAVIVPTTLLCRQHYLNFLDRFAGFNVRVAQLSRLVSAKIQFEVKKGMANGEVNIVIGTHTLLAKDIKFLNLGMVIIDEEQRFGVTQKEKLKRLRSQAHVMSLTATPIPRTLQMALGGVRDMSLITTPPVDRLAVRTFVLPYDRVVIREAILREYHRGGQTFYVCPRISDIGKVLEQLLELVPEVKVVTAHGQMAAKELEDVMLAFDKGKYDVLLATNIIESGIDIPNANTLIIHRSDRFGLAQLYQLRGRVGRGKQRGYAYFTVQADMVLSENSRRRLEVIQTLDTLGAGFQLASHDLDIRGAGNILGDEQSGHIREIGVELYQKMLEEAIANARAQEGFAREKEIERWTPQINLGLPVFIPDTYVPDFSVRMALYQRASDMQDMREVEAFAAELIDRFGSLPSSVSNLLNIIELKQLCRQTNVERIDAGTKGAVITLLNNEFPNPMALVEYINEHKGTIRVRPDQKLSFMQAWKDQGKRLAGVKEVLSDMADLLK